MGDAPELVRCVECRHEYELPPLGEEMGCPDCGGISWVSTRIPESGGYADRPLGAHQARWM
jgi:PHP family Zn ribbon phosphoesterase